MSQAAKTNEPSMEEILASIRKIISDDDTAKPAEAAPAAKPSAPVEEPPPQSQDDIDALMASFDTVEEEPAPPPPPPPVKAKAPPPPPPPPKEPEADIFELTEAVSVPLPAVNDDLDFADVVEEPPKPVVAKVKPRPAPEPEPVWEEEPPLMSGDAQKAVGAAFSSLGALTLSHGGTLDGLVREMLRPMLKQWLDDQLPPLVEKLVKAEIERATRGGR